jgi:hypothetical protein
MTPTSPPPVLESLGDAATAVPPSTGPIVLAVLLVALVAKVLLQSATRPPGRHALRLLDVVIAPLLVVFVIIVLERFHDLAYRVS